MKGIMYKRTLLAVAVGAFSTAAYAQTDCDQQIQQLEQQIQQGQVDQQVQTEVEDLLRAAEENPGDCNTYVARAETLLDQRSQTAQTQQQQQVGQTQQQTSQQGVDKASELMDKSVQDNQGEEIGSIEDLAINMEDGELAYVVLSTGGMFSRKQVGIPADRLRAAPQEDAYVADVTQQELESAQELPDTDWPAQPSIGGQTGAGGTVQPASELIGQSVQDDQGNELGEIEDFALDMQQGKLAYVVVSTSGEGIGGAIGGDQKQVGIPASALQQADEGYVASVSQQEIESAQGLPEDNWPQQPTIAAAGGQQQGAGGVQQSSQLEGQTITNRQGETLGRIEEFALDLQQGRLAYVAITTEEGKRVGIPADMLQEAQQGEGYVADISKQQLQSAQELPEQNWPEQPSVAQGGTQGSVQTAGSFSELDQNQDGYISEEEAQQADQQISENFEQIDRNADQQIDRSEFAAFEQEMQ